jgi:hypothetical protein
VIQINFTTNYANDTNKNNKRGEIMKAMRINEMGKKKYRIGFLELEEVLNNDSGIPSVTITAEGYDDAVVKVKEKIIDLIKQSKPMVQIL